MPIKTKHRKPHHVSHKKEKRTRHFMKVYAPYIPLLLIVGCGIFISGQTEFKRFNGAVKSYATNTSDDGLLEATNKQRIGQGLQPLTFNSQLDQAAQAKAEDMAAKDYWSHTTPDGREPWVFFDDVDYAYKKAAENLAYGFISSDTTVSGWMNSPGHRANILDPVLQEVGFGMANVANYQNRGQQTIVVAMYGQPATLAVANNTPVATPITQLGSAQPQNISYIQSLTAGKAPWSSFAIGLVIGSIVMYLTVRHAHGLRRALRTSENFVIHHPVLDITLVAFAVLAFIAGQSVGSIH